MFRPKTPCVSCIPRASRTSTHLVLFRLQLAVSSLSCQRLDLGRDHGQTLAADVLDDRSDQTVGGGDSDTDVGLFVSGYDGQLHS